MDTHGAHGITRRPKWVMCGVCEEMLWAGPTVYFVEGKPIPRECRCRATRVIASEERGFVQWDKQAYHNAAVQAVAAEINKLSKVAGEEASKRARENGVPAEELSDIYYAAVQGEANRLQAQSEAMIATYPTEPEVEYAQPDEVLPASMPEPVRPTTINQIYKAHWKDIEEGNG